jgi:galactosyl transferase GMA12/MNN10 family
MRKALLTTVTPEFDDMFALSGPPLREFADRHGWSLIVNRADRACGRPTSWGRVPLLLEAMRSYDVVAWIDADALIVDGSRDLAAELRRGKNLYWVEHSHPSGETTANAGVMMLRSSRWSRRLLERAWASEDLIDHVWWENAALMRLLGYRIDAQPVGRGPDRRALARVQFLDLAWNSIPHWLASPTPRITHYAGLPLEDRLERMRIDARTLSAGEEEPPAKSRSGEG